MRTDCGTQNLLITGVQSFLRAECNNDLAGEKAHRYGPSTGNQSVGGPTSATAASLGVNFKDLVDCGVFLPGNTLHEECLWLYFTELIQQDLDSVKIHRNTH